MGLVSEQECSPRFQEVDHLSHRFFGAFEEDAVAAAGEEVELGAGDAFGDDAGAGAVGAAVEGVRMSASPWRTRVGAVTWARRPVTSVSLMASQAAEKTSNEVLRVIESCIQEREWRLPLATMVSR